MGRYYRCKGARAIIAQSPKPQCIRMAESQARMAWEGNKRMAQYQVTVREVKTLVAFIEADSEEEAREFADEDEAEFVEVDGSWEVKTVEKLLH